MVCGGAWGGFFQGMTSADFESALPKTERLICHVLMSKTDMPRLVIGIELVHLRDFVSAKLPRLKTPASRSPGQRMSTILWVVVLCVDKTENINTLLPHVDGSNMTHACGGRIDKPWNPLPQLPLTEDRKARAVFKQAAEMIPNSSTALMGYNTVTPAKAAALFSCASCVARGKPWRMANSR
jgi:hypothetical protein